MNKLFLPFIILVLITMKLIGYHPVENSTKTTSDQLEYNEIDFIEESKDTLILSNEIYQKDAVETVSDSVGYVLGGVSD